MRQLILRVTANAAGYGVELLAGEGQDAAPLAAADIPQPLLLGTPPAGDTWPTIDELRALLGGPAPNDQHLVMRAGRALASLLDPPVLTQALNKELKDAWQRRGSGGAPTLRIVFAIDPPELRSLPWELLRTPKGVSLATQPHTPTSRWYESAQPAPPMEPLTEPLRFLIVVGAEKGDQKVKWEEEVHDIVAVAAPRLHDVDFELLITHRVKQGGLVQALREQLQSFRPHVLHFIGHGRAATSSAQASLGLWDATGANPGMLPWTVNNITNAIGVAPPRLVVVNACHTAAFGTASWLYGFTEALLEAGVAAVVGMQGDIPGESAARFASGFYGSLLRGNPVDVSMIAGRSAIMGAPSAAERDSAMPALVTAVPPDEVLPLSTCPSPASLIVPWFADRREHRRTLRRPTQVKVEATDPGVLLVRGEASIGKTWLVKHALEGGMLRGRRVRYVSFDGRDTMNIIEVLRHIRGPKHQMSTAIEGSLYAEFGPFNDALVALLNGKAPPDKPGTGEDDPTLAYGEGQRAHADTIRLALDAFRRCLVAVTKNEPLVLALDQLGDPKQGKGISAGCFVDGPHSLITDLLAPIRDRKSKLVGDVRCIICATPSQENQFELGRLGANIAACEIRPFPTENFDLIAEEYLLQRFAMKQLSLTQISEYVRGYQVFIKASSFTPHQLSRFGATVEESFP